MGRADTAAALAATLTLLCPAAPARAWEADLAAVEQRVAELEKAWKRLKGRGTVTADRLRRARQRTRPGWTSRSAWTESRRGKTYAFGVGLYRDPGRRAPRNPGIAVSAAEDRARAEILKARSATVEVEEHRDPDGRLRSRTIRGSAKGTVRARLLDWYLDPEDGTVYALAVETR